MILVVGASGTIGGAVVSRLIAEDPRPRVRAFVRTEFDALRLRDQGVEAVVGDLVTGRGVDEAMRGATALVYAADTADREGDIVTNELEAVQHALIAARAAGVRRVVALSHVAASEEARSRYLVARWGVELAVRQSGIEWIVLRTPLVVGRGSLLWELNRRLVDRSPVVPLFRYRHVEVEPVALDDVVEAVCVALRAEAAGRLYYVTGASRVRWGDVLKGWARQSGSHRLFVPVPGWGERALVTLAGTLGRLSGPEPALLVETLRERQVCPDPSLRFPLGRRPLDLEAALAAIR
ncbi:MAG: SDR family oxidoreductase [Dehalococcoidia bacterium]